MTRQSRGDPVAQSYRDSQESASYRTISQKIKAKPGRPGDAKLKGLERASQLPKLKSVDKGKTAVTRRRKTIGARKSQPAARPEIDGPVFLLGSPDPQDRRIPLRDQILTAKHPKRCRRVSNRVRWECDLSAGCRHKIRTISWQRR